MLMQDGGSRGLPDDLAAAACFVLVEAVPLVDLVAQVLQVRVGHES